MDQLNAQLNLLRDGIEEKYQLTKALVVNVPPAPKASVATLLDEIGQNAETILDPIDYQVSPLFHHCSSFT